MREVRASAPGKVNLTLRVGAPTPDGYHPLVTVFEALNLRETVTVRTSKTPGVRVETIAYLPDGSVDEATTRAMADLDPATHLAVRAARVLQRLAAAGPWASTAAGLSIRVDKRVPVAGGMAGGSADAAAALVACNELWELGLGAEQLQAIGRSLGADVPACLAGGIALGTAAAIIVYHGMRGISKLRGTNLEQASPASAPAGSELESEPYASRHRSTQA